MDGKRDFLTPKKRPNETFDVGRLVKRTPDSGIVSGSGKVYQLKVLLPNGMTVMVKIPEGTEAITVVELAGKVKQQHDRAIQEKLASSPRKNVKWDSELSFIDDSDNVFRNSLKLTKLLVNKVYNLRLDDGSQPEAIYENMWDLTPDTELLMELPEEYTFETALADLIDNSLQAVWSIDETEKRLIRVKVSDEKISIVDTGPGMDNTSIEKWGKMGASLHRALKIKAIGGKPPYLKPAFGMFGYGGCIASMHLGRHTKVSSKTRDSKKVYMLCLKRDALVSGSGSNSEGTWRTYGGLRDPTNDELRLSPGGSFTKVEIFEPMMKSSNISQLKCKLKDIYFPYIQCDDLSKKGRTTRPIEFQVNGNDLAEISGGEVAITNLNSCNGPEFILQLRFKLNLDNAITMNSPGARTCNEANARLRCVYLPLKEGKESIDSVLETLKEDGYDYTEEFGSFSHVSCRRLGRLLPDARWAWLPFMDFRQRKVDKSQVFLKRSCMRVKCFIETDAGFSPTPSKTNFAHQSAFTTALRNLGSKQSLEKDMEIDIRRDGRPLNVTQLEKQYQQWLLEMHDRYDEEADSGVDEPVFIVNPINQKELHISKNVMRIHKAFRRKGVSWKSGQRIKILKGACAGFHKNNVYATLEYILIEGIQGDAGGEAWIICRTIDVAEEDGCILESDDENPHFDLKKSVSIPISVIDTGKCLAVDDSEWKNQIDKKLQKCPSSIEILSSSQCNELGIKSSLPDTAEIFANVVSLSEIVAVVRPAAYNSETTSTHLDQKYIIKDNFEMTLAIKFSRNEKSQDESNIYSGRVTPSSRKDFHGLYVFQTKCKSHPLFQKAGIYKFTFSLGDSSCKNCEVKVRVKASREVRKWALAKKTSHQNLTVDCSCKPISVVMFDKYENQIPFLEVPDVVVKINCSNGTTVVVNKLNPSLSLDKSALILEDLNIKSSNLDSIRPNYDATLMLRLLDGSHLLDIPSKVLPGPVKHFNAQPEDFEKQLIPGHVIKELILELFDAYGNHVQENEKVEFNVDGFGWLDRSSSIKKVDAFGCIDLGGLLRVSAGYGRKVSLSVDSHGEKAISKEWEIEKWQLRIASMIPESCMAGSQLENLEFEVVNSKGDVDVSFNDEDKIGQSHTLVIKALSEFVNIDESVKYVFREGRCIVRAVPIPSEEGDFNFVVAHSLHSELQLTVKVRVELPPEMEPLNFRHLSTNENIYPFSDYTQIDYRSVERHTPETNTPALLDTYNAIGLENDLESCRDFLKDLENEIRNIGLRIGQHEEKIEVLNCQKTEIESNLKEMEVASDQTLCIYTYGSPTKNEVKEWIISKSDTAAALVIKFREIPAQDRDGFMENVIGVVALLGTTPTFELSRIFAEYLGDQMLAVVCKSYKDVPVLETYQKNGRLNPKHALHMVARKLGQRINGRFPVLCFEDIRPCKVKKDLQGKLLLPDPALPNGSIPAGFLGYAVNIISIDIDHLDTKTNSGCGLRETLFYRLFGEAQVYESRKDMIMAIPCIKDGAVSLDGGILRGNGALSLGCLEPDIIFPVAVARDEEMSQHDMQMSQDYSEKKLKHKETMDELAKAEKSLERDKKKFSKRRNMYHKYFIRNQSDTGSSQVSPIVCSEKKPIITQSSYNPTPPGYIMRPRNINFC